MRSKRLTATLKVVGWIGFYLLLSAQALILASPDAANGFIVRRARVFDGRRALAQTDVWVEAGKIKAVGKNLKVPSGVKTIDGTGDTLLPGLIDSHTHAWGDALQEAEIFGVTTEFDMFTDVKYMQLTKKNQAEGKNLDLADLRSAGTLATAPGGHGTEYGIPVPTLSAPSEARSWVDARIAEGSDYIKICIPAQQTFTAGSDWKQTSIPFSWFNGTDGHDMSAILFVGGPAAGKFDFQIDEVKLE